MASLSSDLPIDRIKLISRRKKKLISSNLVFEFVPPRKPAELYEDFVKCIELEYKNCRKKTSAFKKLIQDCKERRITVRETESRTDRLFKDHPKLVTDFCNTVLPYLYPVSTRDEVDKANQFIHCVESVFPDDQRRSDVVENLIVRFQDGRLSLKDMTVKMLKLLENKDDLIKAYIKFVPQAEHVIASNIRKRRFITYLAVVAVIFASGIGFHSIQK